MPMPPQTSDSTRPRAAFFSAKTHRSEELTTVDDNTPTQQIKPSHHESRMIQLTAQSHRISNTE
jgi:hypothetical protein